MIFLLVRESHNNTVKQLRPYILKPEFSVKGPHFYYGNDWILCKIFKFWIYHIMEHLFYFSIAWVDRIKGNAIILQEFSTIQLPV